MPFLHGGVAVSGSGNRLALHLVFGDHHADPAPLPVVLRWLDLRGSKPALAYPVTESLSLSLRYSYSRGEDLAFKVAKTGSLDDDYRNHRVLVRALWQF